MSQVDDWRSGRRRSLHHSVPLVSRISVWRSLWDWGLDDTVLPRTRKCRDSEPSGRTHSVVWLEKVRQVVGS